MWEFEVRVLVFVAAIMRVLLLAIVAAVAVLRLAGIICGLW